MPVWKGRRQLEQCSVGDAFILLPFLGRLGKLNQVQELLLLHEHSSITTFFAVPPILLAAVTSATARLFQEIREEQNPSSANHPIRQWAKRL